ncbi:MAG: hypothetical protein AMJ43_03880 [Coxiella sp. DG_40]|nr:MAG: hypothetical protein AMJ43_03880 [Coxiella sp. DG_40]
MLKQEKEIICSVDVYENEKIKGMLEQIKRAPSDSILIDIHMLFRELFSQSDVTLEQGDIFSDVTLEQVDIFIVLALALLNNKLDVFERISDDLRINPEAFNGYYYEYIQNYEDKSYKIQSSLLFLAFIYSDIKSFRYLLFQGYYQDHQRLEVKQESENSGITNISSKTLFMSQVAQEEKTPEKYFSQFKFNITDLDEKIRLISCIDYITTATNRLKKKEADWDFNFRFAFFINNDFLVDYIAKMIEYQNCRQQGLHSGSIQYDPGILSRFITAYIRKAKDNPNEETRKQQLTNLAQKVLVELRGMNEIDRASLDYPRLVMKLSKYVPENTGYRPLSEFKQRSRSNSAPSCLCNF